ncbi:hypothetical protein MSG28_014426 [Choristoneura fumiferana]|uniref:Uncharacterized protein n=1 Tax=Choristoneura fumiferana TaxID=7141 RepID=A0ACC0JRE3_CHOFU|nr:hypothetical protein MSG28_014426 [Choristoneura fumiferana]
MTVRRWLTREAGEDDDDDDGDEDTVNPYLGPWNAPSIKHCTRFSESVNDRGNSDMKSTYVAVLPCGYVNYAIVGSLKRTDDVEPWQVRRIRRIIKHPHFNPYTKHNDIALLETDPPCSSTAGHKPLPWHATEQDPRPLSSCSWQPPCENHRSTESEDALRYVCRSVVSTQELVYPKGSVWDRRQCRRVWTCLVETTTGRWRPVGGVTEYLGQVSDTLQKVTLTKFTDRECSENYPVNRFGAVFNSTIQVCYGDYQRRADTCQGDSGGPLTILNHGIHCMYTVVGITSFGMNCGSVGEPGWYTKVSYYVPWIESIVWP